MFEIKQIKKAEKLKILTSFFLVNKFWRLFILLNLLSFLFSSFFAKIIEFYAVNSDVWGIEYNKENLSGANSQIATKILHCFHNNLNKFLMFLKGTFN